MTLGQAYEKGEGLTQNDVQTYRWCIAAASGMYVADMARKALLQKMSKEEVLDAQRLVRETVMLQE